MSTDRAIVLAEVAGVLEELRQPNPMNGDGSNYMLTKALNAIVGLADDDGPLIVAAVMDVRARKEAEDRERYERRVTESLAEIEAATPHAPDRDASETRGES